MGQWRRRSGNEQRRDSTIEEAFANTNLPITHGPTALWRPGGFQENGPMCAVSSSHLVPKLSGILARTVSSKFLMKLLETNIPTRAATTKYGFISCMSTHDWLIARTSRWTMSAANRQEQEQSVRPQIEPCGHPRKKFTWSSA